jgi:hypothetical protein
MIHPSDFRLIFDHQAEAEIACELMDNKFETAQRGFTFGNQL